MDLKEIKIVFQKLIFLLRIIKFGKWIIISRHIEDLHEGRTSIPLLEDCLEAFIGAIFLDFNEPSGPHKDQLKKYKLVQDNYYTGMGFHICELFFINLIEEMIDFVALDEEDTNYKKQLCKVFVATNLKKMSKVSL